MIIPEQTYKKVMSYITELANRTDKQIANYLIENSSNFASLIADSPDSVFNFITKTASEKKQEIFNVAGDHKDVSVLLFYLSTGAPKLRDLLNSDEKMISLLKKIIDSDSIDSVLSDNVAKFLLQYTPIIGKYKQAPKIYIFINDDEIADYIKINAIHPMLSLVILLQNKITYNRDTKTLLFNGKSITTINNESEFIQEKSRFSLTRLLFANKIINDIVASELSKLNASNIVASVNISAEQKRIEASVTLSTADARGISIIESIPVDLLIDETNKYVGGLLATLNNKINSWNSVFNTIHKTIMKLADDKKIGSVNIEAGNISFIMNKVHAEINIKSTPSMLEVVSKFTTYNDNALKLFNDTKIDTTKATLVVNDEDDKLLVHYIYPISKDIDAISATRSITRILDVLNDSSKKPNPIYNDINDTDAIALYLLYLTGVLPPAGLKTNIETIANRVRNIIIKNTDINITQKYKEEVTKKKMNIAIAYPDISVLTLVISGVIELKSDSSFSINGIASTDIFSKLGIDSSQLKDITKNVIDMITSTINNKLNELSPADLSRLLAVVPEEVMKEKYKIAREELERMNLSIIQNAKKLIKESKISEATELLASSPNILGLKYAVVHKKNSFSAISIERFLIQVVAIDNDFSFLIFDKKTKVGFLYKGINLLDTVTIAKETYDSLYSKYLKLSKVVSKTKVGEYIIPKINGKIISKDMKLPTVNHENYRDV